MFDVIVNGLLLPLLNFLIEFFKWIIVMGTLILVPIFFFRGLGWVFGEANAFIKKIMKRDSKTE